MRALAPRCIIHSCPQAGPQWTGHNWQVIFILAGLMVGISVGLAKAYQSPRPQVIATFDYAYLPFAALWGFVFFGEIPDLWTVLGMALIAAAGLIVLRATSRRTPSTVAV
ncbi:DMT family transporter [Mesorhizobium sp.]|uniref:DMT family transporter n=1 Tax=Mesorhizobium sp. TaxID=1871066 RepID=UPI00344EB98C